MVKYTTLYVFFCFIRKQVTYFILFYKLSLTLFIVEKTTETDIVTLIYITCIYERCFTHFIFSTLI